jgi:proteic killer suppression protein
VIISFGCNETEMIFQGMSCRPFASDIQVRARRKLVQLDNSSALNDLKIPPSNRLERLKGDLQGYLSIRVNKQWRIIFIWDDGNPDDVKLIDYH